MTDKTREALAILDSILAENNLETTIDTRIRDAMKRIDSDEATLFDMCRAIFVARAKQASDSGEREKRSAYISAADMLDYAIRDNYDCLKEYGGSICAAMSGITLDEYSCLRHKLDQVDSTSDRAAVLSDLLNNHSCRVGRFIMERCSAGNWEFHDDAPGDCLTLQCHGPLTKVLDIFMLLLEKEAFND